MTDRYTLAEARAARLPEYKDVVEDALAAAWPVLSAGLREMHAKSGAPMGQFPGDRLLRHRCEHCCQIYPCATVRELDRIDQELGIETDKELGL